MTIQQVTARNKSGLHARPASIFVKEAQKYQSQITIAYMGKEYNAKSILGVMAACIKCDAQFEIHADGADEAAAVNGLTAAVQAGLGEEE